MSGLGVRFADPAEMVELSRDLEIYSKEHVKQAGRLSSGEKEIRFTVEHLGADGRAVRVPDVFLINIPMFSGAQAVRVPVRLRYRKTGEKLLWLYDLYRLDRAFQQAYNEACDTVERETGLPLYHGAPENISFKRK